MYALTILDEALLHSAGLCAPDAAAAFDLLQCAGQLGSTRAAVQLVLCIFQGRGGATTDERAALSIWQWRALPGDGLAVLARGACAELHTCRTPSTTLTERGRVGVPRARAGPAGRGGARRGGGPGRRAGMTAATATTTTGSTGRHTLERGRFSRRRWTERRLGRI